MLELCLLLLALALVAGAHPERKTDALPPDIADEVRRVLATRNPDQYDQLAAELDAIGFHQSAALLRRQAVTLRASAPVAAPVPSPPAAAPVAPSGPHGPLPGPSAPACAAPGAPVQGEKLALVPGCRYRARLKLSGLACLATADDIAQVLQKMGLRDVRIYRLASELPADWPRAQIASETGPPVCTRYAEGTWSGPAATVAKPAVVEALWIAG